MSRSELIGFLGINNSSFQASLQAGHPPPVPGKGFDLDASCRWFAARPGNGKAKKRALAHLGNDQVVTAPQQKPRTGKRGIEAAVARLRTAEESLHRSWQTAVSGRDAAAQTHFRNWTEAVEILAKSEPALVKFRKDTGALTETAKFKSELKRNIESAKSILLDLPGRVAPQCEGIPWHQVQKLLESEIRRALEKLAAK